MIDDSFRTPLRPPIPPTLTITQMRAPGLPRPAQARDSDAREAAGRAGVTADLSGPSVYILCLCPFNRCD